MKSILLWLIEARRNVGCLLTRFLLLLGAAFCLHAAGAEVAGIPRNEPATRQFNQTAAAALESAAQPLPSIILSDINVDEAAETISFPVTLSQQSQMAVTVDYAAGLDIDDEAVEGSDFVPVSGTITIAPGTWSQSISIKIIDNLFYNNDPTFTIFFSNQTNALLPVDRAKIRIFENDFQPLLLINDAYSLVGSNNSATVTFQASLTQLSTLPITVEYFTQDGSAVAGRDYLATHGTLIIKPGQTNGAITVPVLDSAAQVIRTFQLILSNSPSAILSDGEGIGTITPRPPREISMSGEVSVKEGNRGATNAGFLVTLSRASSEPASVEYATANGTAIAGIDYGEQHGILLFPPGTTTNAILVPVYGNSVNEPRKTFQVQLSNPVNGKFKDGSNGRSIGIIENDDPEPFASIGNATTMKENASWVIPFPVVLSAPSGQPVRLDFMTTDGTATNGIDYTGVTGSLEFQPGETNKTVTVIVLENPNRKSTKTLFLVIKQAVNAQTLLNSGTGTIVVESIPEIRITDVRTPEGDIGWTNASFQIELSAASEKTVSVDYFTTDGTALAGSDYRETKGTLIFQPGDASKTLQVPIQGNMLNETDKTFAVHLLNATNAIVARNQASGVILNDDPEPTLTIAPVSIMEGTSGIAALSFRVALSAPSGRAVSVEYSTLDQTANAGSDYVSTNGVLTIPPGQTNQTLAVGVIGDLAPESDETLRMLLTNAVHALLVPGKESAIGLIRNDDFYPTLSIGDGLVTEPISGSTNVTLTVRLSSAWSEPVSVDYATVDGTALSGKDYAGQTNTLIFPPGSTTSELNLQILADGKADGDKTFSVQLFNPSHADLGDSQGRVDVLQATFATNPPPVSIALSATQNRAVYPYDARNGTSVFITAAVDAPGRKILRVDFYRGSMYVASSEYGPEYSIVWYGVIPVGNYSLTARAIDMQGGIAISSPIEICVSDTWRNVALIQSSSDPEIASLQQYLFEMGLSVTTLDMNVLNTNAFNAFDLVLWHSGSDSSTPLGSRHMAILQALAKKPVYFLGNNLIQSAAQLSNAEHDQWLRALHVQNAGSVAASGAVEIDANTQPLLGKRYGMAAGFAEAGTIEGIQAASDAISLAHTEDSDSMIAFNPQDASGVKRVSQFFRTASGSDEHSRKQRKSLFQNSVNWLIDGPDCEPGAFDLQLTGPAGAMEPGQKMTFTIRVRQNGGCTATGVVLTNYLPPGATVDSFECINGSVITTSNKVVFNLGLFNNTDTAEMKLVLLPQAAGAITNIVSAGSNATPENGFQWATNITLVGASLKASLSVERPVASPPELRLTAKAGQVYRLQESANLKDWQVFTNNILTGWHMPLTTNGSGTRFFRALTP